MKLLNALSEINTFSIIARLVLATLLGSLIGLERSSKGHMAGLRTFSLVCLGSSAATVINLMMYETMGNHIDPSRISAQIISGIGFLGAGSILVTGRNQIKGLTTAASLWATAIMGMAIGAGFLVSAITCFVLIMTTIQLFSKISRKAKQHCRVISLTVEVEKDKGSIRLRKFLNQCGYHIISMERCEQQPIRDTDTVLEIEIDFRKKVEHSKIIEMIGDLEYVNYLEQI